MTDHDRHTGAPFRWDRERQVLVYDGSHDPDPDWKWNAAKGGYEPVDSDLRIFDRRIGVWVYAPATVN